MYFCANISSPSHTEFSEPELIFSLLLRLSVQPHNKHQMISHLHYCNQVTEAAVSVSVDRMSNFYPDYKAPLRLAGSVQVPPVVCQPHMITERKANISGFTPFLLNRPLSRHPGIRFLRKKRTKLSSETEKKKALCQSHWRSFPIFSLMAANCISGTKKAVRSLRVHAD